MRFNSKGELVADLNVATAIDPKARASNGFKDVQILLTGSRESELENEGAQSYLNLTHNFE